MTEDNDLDAPLDNLSSMGRKLLRFNGDQSYRRLVVQGGGDAGAKAILEDVKPSDLLAAPITDHDYAASVLAGVWLWHDWLDESHRICQAIETPTGSLWHGIMHRREGDFPNSKYWYSRVGQHPVYPSITANANAVLNPLPMDKNWVRLTHPGWNPAILVDLCQAASGNPDDPRLPILVNLQQLEWRTLFDHCVREATK